MMNDTPHTGDPQTENPHAADAEHRVSPLMPEDAALAQALAQATESLTPGTDARDAEIARLSEELNATKDHMLRAVAEAENTRKRLQREQEESSKFAIAGFARDLVGAVENLGRAMQSIPEAARGEHPLLNTLALGLDMTLKELLSALERHGVKRIDPVGEKFDHNFHQAVAQVETAESEPGTVMQVFQAGYILHDRLIRPAMVSVAKAAASPTTPPPAAAQAG